ncbi:hypothetical protein Tco_0804034 [Tanacetum coccineum]|uniref:Uncharacterized protein n=1 Tax=Tanacetum coccineum TaxID=301880 RepID=A0ABQ5A603_9ASTR
MTMDVFTKGALWDYWKLGSDEVEPTNEKTFDLEETNQDDEREISEIFRIETNLFDYETPLCEKFKEFNYLLKIDPSLHSRNHALLPRFRMKSWDEFEITNDDRNKWEYESEHEDDERYELCGNETHEFPVRTVRRFEMIKYSFGQDEEYAAVKEDEYEDLTSTSKDACQTYQEIFRMMDEGWMDLAVKKSTKLVKYQSSGILCVIVVILEYRRIYNTHPCSQTQLEESTEQNIRGVSHSNSF